MSETSMWPTRSKAGQFRAGVDELRARIGLLSGWVSGRVHDFRGDEFREVRDLLVAIVGELRDLDPADLASLLSQADQAEENPLPVRTPGATRLSREDTQGWIAGQVPYMRRNRGHQ